MQDWVEVRKRLEDRFPTGVIPRQDLPSVTGYKASYFAAMAAKGEGPEYFYQGKLCMYPIRPLLEWLKARSVNREDRIKEGAN